MANNKWYKCPAVFDETLEWFICFDDDDPPEIVIKSSGQLSKQHQKEKIENTLRDAGIKAKILNHNVCGSRLFPPSWKEFVPSIRAFLKIECNIDLSNLKVTHDGVYPDIPSGMQCVMYDFNYG